ncbi:class I SAM-dependent methyltransferase [Ramlibacter humi]|uniref:Class I SAM-dependent methyltransferase n=1 Tax=Ramlibacter humi TaxID=2530451 RepID=A0A4Z0CCD5_9BURK|nr:class I SAM-dependent methyltransferase [Ramlibacter humi]TFZ07875.1 class I SAM-dependent methyltransferase [Ramlibacter humi]
MAAAESDRVFAGSVPQLYERHMVPMIFEPYAADLAARVQRMRPAAVLEIAAGTGAVTRELARVLPASTRIVATDLNQAMLDQAIAKGTPREVEWHQADAMQLPFENASFDLVVCQFGVMFFPDKPKAFSEVRRVLRPGGTFLFNVWDSLEENDFALAVTQALEPLYPQDPPRFMARTPHGYHDAATIHEHLREAGFTADAAFDTVTARSRSDSARTAALAYCQGTPMRAEIESRSPPGLEEATVASAAMIAQRFGQGSVDGKIQAHVVTVSRT